MDRVLQIPELLRLIFIHLDSSYQLHCALVCKEWSEVALDMLWSSLDDPIRLFSLLAPHEKLWSEFRYERPIRADDWKVFDRYASRVRTLQLDYLSSWRVQDQVFSEVAKKRPHLTLLPKLRRLKIVPNTELNLVHSLLFFGQNIRELEFRWLPELSTIGRDCLSDFFDECAARLQKLKKFELYGFGVDYVTQLQADTVKLLPSMIDLETFSCSLYYATQTTFVALSQLPSLRVITFDYPSKCGVGEAVDVIDFCPKFPPGSFPALVDLSFSATFAEAATFLEKDFAPNLEKLFIHSPTLETASQLGVLLTTLISSRQKLVQLCLSSISPVSGDSSDREEYQDIYRVTIDTLCPLSAFSSLVDFQIAYHCPFQLDDRDLGILVEDWPHLEVLHLCSDPFLRGKPMLTPAVLPIIAKCCPKLRALSLYIDTHIEDPCPPVADPLYPTRFSSLRRIEFGTSSLEENDVTGICLYLSDLLPGTCDIDTLCGVSWLLENELARAGFGVEREVVLRWKQVSAALKMLIKAREQERLRASDLQMEARDLEMRVAMLENQQQLGLAGIIQRKGSSSTCVHQ